MKNFFLCEALGGKKMQQKYRDSALFNKPSSIPAFSVSAGGGRTSQVQTGL